MDRSHFSAFFSLREADPTVHGLITREERRQREKLILIPSESVCPPPVLQALASPFSNIYAEGYPLREMFDEGEDALGDEAFQAARHRRYFDRRFYKGCDYANILESLASRRARELFATAKNPPGRIFANVQPLSGAAANNAVYSALLRPGDVIMGMSLMHGGHLTHGSEFNRSGKTYRAAAYEVSPETERLDYDRILKQAKERRPRLIIAGYTSYPWAPDWPKFREIADEVGALLLADVAHTSGMIAAGVHPNPVDYADVLTFTTHKTLFGPRAAVILTTSAVIAELIDQAVFPGEQGGPHVNTFAALAVAFRLAGTEAFRDVQRRILGNARRLAAALERNGLSLAYGGTDSHLLVVDLRGLKTKTGYPLKGDTAVRMLDLAGIVANKNTIPGDEATAESSGVRMGTPWVTQRGITVEGIDELGAVIAGVTGNILPFSYRGLEGPLPRGKIELEVLEKARERVRELAASLSPVPYPASPAGTGALGNFVTAGAKGAFGAEGAGGIIVAAGNEAGPAPKPDEPRPLVVLEIRGRRAVQFCDQVGTQSAAKLGPGDSSPTLLLGRDGKLVARAVLGRLERDDAGMDRFVLALKREDAGRVSSWLRGLSDGYALFDDGDIFRKIEGPVAIEERTEGADHGRFAHLLDGALAPGAIGADAIGEDAIGEDAAELYRSSPGLFDLSKPYFIGRSFLEESRAAAAGPPAPCPSGPCPRGSPDNVEGAPQSTILHEEHLKLTKSIVEFAGWMMPVRYEGILEEHRAVRRAAGLFDVTHMGVLEVAGECAERFLDAVTSNYVPWMRDWESQYGYLLSPDGSVIDDVMLYRITKRRFIMVVNAVNAAKDLSWLQEVSSGGALIDLASRLKRTPGPVRIRDLKESSAGNDQLVDLALQGPAAPAILGAVSPAGSAQRDLARLGKSGFARTQVAGFDAYVSRTGYTGEREGYELFVHPDLAPALWRALLEAGERFGLKPAGLGARDSLRIEAGLPLYGHELAGPRNISPVEAGFGPYVKFHKPFFVGRDELLKRERRSTMEIVRFRKTETGTRMAKGGDLVIGRRAGKVIGEVTSSAMDGEGFQVGMAFVEKAHAREGTRIGILPGGHSGKTGEGAGLRAAGALEQGASFPVYDDAEVIRRFPSVDEA